MLRSTLLYLSNQQKIFQFVRRNGLAKKFAARFVAGETVDTALAAVATLNAHGIHASLDILGESVHNEAEARETRRQYTDLLDPTAEPGPDTHAPLKPT